MKISIGQVTAALEAFYNGELIGDWSEEQEDAMRAALEISEKVGKEEEYIRLIKRLESARNYSYEATMGDYSMSSINRAQVQVEAAKQALIDAGYEVPEW